MLGEYAEIFSVVGGDFSFYQFPSPSYWQKLFDETPATLRFGLKVPEEITVPRWPGHARYGTRGDREQGLSGPRAVSRAVHMAPGTLPRPGGGHDLRVRHVRQIDLCQTGRLPARLDPFLSSVSRHFRYSVEIRNAEYLGPDYFSLLHAHNTAHVFNAWTRMPELLDQIAMPDAFTADFTVVRALLKKGRAYEQAVKAFEPYKQVQEPNPGAREALRQIADRAWKTARAGVCFREQPA